MNKKEFSAKPSESSKESKQAGSKDSIKQPQTDLSPGDVVRYLHGRNYTAGYAFALVIQQLLTHVS